MVREARLCEVSQMPCFISALAALANHSHVCPWKGCMNTGICHCDNDSRQDPRCGLEVILELPPASRVHVLTTLGIASRTEVWTLRDLRQSWRACPRPLVPKCKVPGLLN